MHFLTCSALNTRADILKLWGEPSCISSIASWNDIAIPFLSSSESIPSLTFPASFFSAWKPSEFYRVQQLSFQAYVSHVLVNPLLPKLFMEACLVPLLVGQFSPKILEIHLRKTTSSWLTLKYRIFCLRSRLGSPCCGMSVLDSWIPLARKHWRRLSIS